MSRERRSTNETDSIRNKRLLANIRSSLGGNNAQIPSPPIRKNPKQENTTDVQTLAEVIQKISISNSDVSCSLLDIKPFLKRNSDNLSDDDLTQLSNVLCETALEQTDIYCILDICMELIAHQKFQNAMSDCLKILIGKYLEEQEEKDNIRNIPNLMAQLLIYKWPRRFNRAIEGSNAILFTITSTIIGWIKFVNEKCKDDADFANDAESFLFMRCVEGLIAICTTGQRYLWLSYPELFDEIYDTNVELLVSNINIRRW